MKIEDLFCGVGLVVDDQVLKSDTRDRIRLIVKDLESKRIPLAKYDSIPDIGGVHCRNLSFVLLDWELVSIQDEQNIPLPGSEELKRSAQEKLITFVRDLLSECYLPIFIFSNTDQNTISSSLLNAGVRIQNLPIFIEKKSNIVEDGNTKVWAKIEEWVRDTPSIYVYKVWQNSCSQAGVLLMKDLSVSKSWPQLIWSTAVNDGAKPGQELSELLSQNLLARMTPIEFEEEIVSGVAQSSVEKDEIQKILQAQRYTVNFDNDSSVTGDLYKINKDKYLLNIRPSCDCVQRKDYDGCVYLIQGSKLTSNQLKTKFDHENGNFKEQHNEVIVGPVDNGKFISFRFKNLSVQEYDKVKNSKIGRVLPPFITHVTEKFGLYIQRQGLPKLPKEAVLSQDNISQIPEPNTEGGNEDDKCFKSVCSWLYGLFCK